MTDLFDNWTDEKVGSLLTYMVNCDEKPNEYNEMNAIQDKLLEEAVQRGMIEE